MAGAAGEGSGHRAVLVRAEAMDRRAQANFAVAATGVPRVVDTRRPVLFLEGLQDGDLIGRPNVEPFDERAVRRELERLGAAMRAWLGGATDGNTLALV